ncbi:hypothetical protein [Desertivirga xinjiangensis]|uniref:hypothetical protein n=1 Tax=Desertivirga xinjiangensis TaxID=539206 RepID=UPI00210B0965|nr:hypothetical protein [Pedobacter xinjiangensis]
MKAKLKYFIVIFLAAVSCQSEKRTRKAKDTTTIEVETLNNKEVPKKAIKGGFPSVLNGDWVQTDYVESIKVTKSPARSHNKIGKYSSIIIQEAEKSADSLYVGCSMGNHEGWQFTIYPGLSGKDTLYKTNLIDYDDRSNYYLLGYSVGGDTTLTLFHYNKNNKLIDKTEYTRILKSSSSNSVESGIQYLANREVFAGKYICSDSLGHSKTVSFSPEGNLSGFSGYQTYRINTDFDEPDENTADLIGFNTDKKNNRYFVFEGKQGEILLYNYSDIDGRGMDISKTSLVYTLRPVRK